MQLIIERGPLAGQSYSLESGQTVTVGRTAEAAWMLPEDKLLSNVHFRLSWDGSTLTVRDLNSKFGTTLNGTRIEEAVVQDGDRLKAGTTVWRVEGAGQAPAAGIAKAAPVVSATPAFPPSSAPSASATLGNAGTVLDYLRSLKEPLFAILDAAREPPDVLSRCVHCPHEHQSLYEGAKGETLAPYGPYLVSLPKNSEYLTELVKTGWGRSWGVYLTSMQPFAEVRKHLRRFLMVELPENKKAYFRFYDPRVMRVYAPTCTNQEWLDFMGPIKQFVVEDQAREAILAWSPSSLTPHRVAFSGPG